MNTQPATNTPPAVLNTRSVIVYHTTKPQPYAKYLRLPGDLGYIRAEGFDGSISDALDAAFPLPGEAVCNSHPIV